MPIRPSLEPLEARIAPANLFVSAAASGPNALKVFTDTKANAQDSPNEILAANLTGATAAVYLAPGDHLIFDADSNQVVSKGDYVLVDVTAGGAVVFLTNNSAGTNIRAFEKNEISGLALADGFIGTIHTDVNGTIATALDNTDHVTINADELQITRSRIASLTIEGQIAGGFSGAGHLLAGQDLEHVTVTGRHFNRGAQFSVSGTVATGNAAASLVASFNGGLQTFDTTYAAAEGSDGGDIRDLTLPFGAQALLTGDGAPGLLTAGGSGGNIENVRVVSSVPTLVRTGHGGTSSDIMGQGLAVGNGGSISHSFFQFSTKPTDTVALSTGAGAASPTSHGGAGGSFIDVEMVLPKPAQQLGLVAGAGGASSTNQKGGQGGGFDTLDLEVNTLRGPAASDRVLNLTAGAGGLGGPSGGDGGDGGSIVGLTFTTAKSTASSLREFFQAGAGADGSSNGGRGGAGGEVRGANFILRGAVSEIRILGGQAGDVMTPTGGAGAPGGGVNDTHIFIQNDPGDVLIFGGRGGDGGGSAAGPGGSIANFTYANLGAKTGDLSLQGGDGGIATNARGGDGGVATGLRLNNAGSIAGTLRIAGGGFGGFVDTAAGISRTGDGGGVSAVTINNFGPFAGAEIVSGAESATSIISGNGSIGRSGAISSVTVNDSFGAFTDLRPFRIHTGATTLASGGAANDGAESAPIDKLHFNAPKSTFLVYAGDAAGTAAANRTGGHGSDISNLTGRVRKLTINAGRGGDAPAGTGGAGGDVHDVYLSYVGAFVQMVAAGNGGTGATAGAGGSVHDLSLAGAIGDFTKPFSTFEAHLDDPGSGESVGMGGLIAGQAGAGAGGAANGSIANVSATRIAAILAGRPTADHVGYANAVTSIMNLHATALGADVNRNAKFDFIEGGANTTFEPSDDLTPTDGDQPIDGFVLVKAAGSPGLPVTPFKLIQV